jgi:hypothetical protein
MRFINDQEYAFMTRKYLIGFFRKIDNQELQNIIPKEDDVLSSSTLQEIGDKGLYDNEQSIDKPDKPDEEIIRLNFNIFCIQYERARVPFGEFGMGLLRFEEETTECFKVKFIYIEIKF